MNSHEIPRDSHSFLEYDSIKNPLSSIKTCGSRITSHVIGVVWSFNMLLYEIEEVFSVLSLLKRLCESSHIIIMNPSSTMSNFLRTTDLESLSFFDNMDKIGSIEHTLMRSCIEPCKSTIHDLDLELRSTKIFLVDRCDLEFATLAWSDILGDPYHIIGIKIESHYRKSRLGVLGFFFY